MSGRHAICILAISTVLALFCQSANAEVYVNRLWDEDFQQFRVLPLILEGGGVKWDRGYQNAYGKLYELEPGPPFIVESAILIQNLYDAAGEVTAWGSLTIESGGFGLMDPFDVRFISDGNDFPETYIISEGPITVRGSFFDPIHFEGYFYINTLGLSVHGPRYNEFDVLFQNVFFKEHYGNHVGNLMNFQFGHVTIENCTFDGYGEPFNRLITYSATFPDMGAHWDFTMRNCLFSYNSVEANPVYLQYLRSVVLENNRFVHNLFDGEHYPGVIDMQYSGIHRLAGNSGSGNTVNALYSYSAGAVGDATIRTSDDFPLALLGIRVGEDESLSIEPGSVLKVVPPGASYTNFPVSGEMIVDHAVLTHFMDDTHGGNTDLTPQPDELPSYWGNGGGIKVDSTGNLIMRNSLIQYCVGGIAVHGDAVIDSSIIRNHEYYGVAFVGHGHNTLEISNSTIANTVRKLGPGFYFSNQYGESMDVDLRNVSILNSNEYGMEINTLGDAPSRFTIEDCRIAASDQEGIWLNIGEGLRRFDVKRSFISCNGENGFYAYDYGDSGRVRLESNVFSGNGWTHPYGAGAHLDIHSAHLVNNTFAYTGRIGLGINRIGSPVMSTVANNIFYRNGNHGSVTVQWPTAYFGCNAYWENTPAELMFQGPSEMLYTVEEVIALGDAYATNLHQDPLFVDEWSGQIDTVGYNKVSGESFIVDPGAFSERSTKDMIVCVDSVDPTWFLITRKTDDTLFVAGDARSFADIGNTYVVFDHHLSENSLLVDVGQNLNVYFDDDIDGETRILDGDDDDSLVVDIGADEFNPDSSEYEPMQVTSPTAGQVCRVGDTVTIEWTAPAVDSLHIIYYIDWYDTSMANLPTTIVTNYPADSNRYRWAIPNELSTRCLIIISNADDPGHSARSEMFAIRGWQLARYAADSTFDKYRPNPDGWSFSNDSASMWPNAWWSQFDYALGVDPYTGREYPDYWNTPGPVMALPADFPDWPLFVAAYGDDQCYFTLPAGRVYRPMAVATWSARKGKWAGSCAGFSSSSLAAFDDHNAFANVFPEVGPFADLFSLPLSDSARKVVNLWYVRRSGRAMINHLMANVAKSPKETLEDIKQMFLAEDRNDADLYIADSLNRGAHAITPFRVTRDPAHDSIWRVYVYESNEPGDTIHFIKVDTGENEWQYMYNPRYKRSNRMLLMQPALEHLTPPEMEFTPTPPLLAAMDPGSTGSLLFCNCATATIISNPADDSVGHCDDTSFNTIAGALPVILPDAPTPCPTAYFLPENAYSMRLSGHEDSLVQVFQFNSGVVYGYGRAHALDFETDLINMDTGFFVSNPDTNQREIGIMAVVPKDTCELAYLITDCLLGQTGVMGVSAIGDTSLSVSNGSGSRTYQIELLYASETTGYSQKSGAVDIDPTTTHVLLPGWGFPDQYQLKILIDNGSDGTIDDSTLVDMQVQTGIGEADGLSIPTRFALSQNYPNPFNPATTIRYSIPRGGHFVIEVFNILGQKVRTLIDHKQPAGEHQVVWNGTDQRGNRVASGVYLYRLTSGHQVQTRKMLLVK